MKSPRDIRRHTIHSLVLLCGASLLPAQAPSASSAAAMERTFQTAMAAQDRGDVQTAESMLVLLHKAHPGNFAVNESLGLLYAGQRRYDAALPLLRVAMHEQPSSDVAHTNLGAAYFRLGKNQEAATEFERATRINPRNLAAQQSLGRALMELHQSERAADAYAAALSLDPANADLMQDHAQALLAAGHADAARDQLQSVPALEQSASAQSLLGEIDEKRGDFLAAVQHFEHAAQLDPSEANIWAVGVEFLRHWTFPAAVREFEAGVARYAASTRMKVGLGAAYFGDAKYPQAINVFADLLKESPGNALYAEFLGMSCNTALQQKQPRCLELIAYAKNHPRDARVSAYAAASLRSQDPERQDPGLARQLLSAAIAADPNLAEAQYQMAILEQDENSWPDSIPYLERAIKLKPDYAQAHYHLALAYWRGGRKQEAQQQMDLQKQYSHQEEQDLDQRLRQIVTFRIDSHE